MDSVPPSAFARTTPSEDPSKRSRSGSSLIDSSDAGRTLAATALIQAIRDENKAQGSLHIVQRALEIISEQLYETSTHFLFELIQNADDATFGCGPPTLQITHGPGSLRVDCNEIGFTDNDIRAICTVGESTKSSSDTSTGEKGIGFKSVFKIADVVWIASNEYQFKFDRHQDGIMGMIAPQWDAFPEETFPGWTSFYLKVKEDYDTTDLVDKLRSFDPSLLIFLRNLKQIKLDITSHDGKRWNDSLWVDRGLSSQIKAGRKGSTTSYLVQKQLVTMPSNLKGRKSSLQANVILAFQALDPNQEPSMTSRMVHSYLPVSDHGFNFLIQSDFVLTADRERIDQSSEWNLALREEIACAFINFVHQMNKGSGRYHWPQFVPTYEVSSFFGPMRTSILEQLSTSDVIESWAGTLAPPGSLIWVGPRFLDRYGEPLTLHEHTAPRYLSSRYPVWESEALKNFGVTTLLPNDFLNELTSMSDSLFSKPPWWHEDLAKSILPLMGEEKYRRLAESLCLIPLQSGEWTQAYCRRIIFPPVDGEHNIPHSSGVLILDPAFITSPDRRSLFEHLGVTSCSTRTICELILRRHSAGHSSSTPLSRKQLVEETVYLFRSGWNSKFVVFPFATTQGRTCSGSETYVRRSVEAAAPLKRVYQAMMSKYHFIHADYYTALSSHDSGIDWRDWLSSSFGVKQLPSLFMNPSRPRGTSPEISEELTFLVSKGHSADVLWTLTEHWSHYSQMIDHHTSRIDRQSSTAMITEIFSSVPVRCRSGHNIPLPYTVLPALDFDAERSPVDCILEIDDPEDARWMFLHRFGVAVKANAFYYLRCLASVRNRSVDDQNLVYLYNQIQKLYHGNESAIVSSFRDTALIRLPDLPSNSKTYSWLTSAEATHRLPEVEAYYPTCTRLMRCLLSTSDPGLNFLIRSAMRLKGEHSLAEIIKLLKALDKSLKTADKLSEEQSKVLSSITFLPIVNTKNTTGFDYLERPTATDFYIGDREKLKASFLGKVPLLALDGALVAELDCLLSALNLDGRQLSRLVRIETNAQGHYREDTRLTALLRSRAPFIQSLIPRSAPDRDATYGQIIRARAMIVSGIVQSPVLQLEHRTIDGMPISGQIHMSADEDQLQLFLTEDHAQNKQPTFELIEAMKEFCHIEISHQLLLNLALTESDFDRIRSTLLQHGIYVDASSAFLGTGKPANRAKQFAASAKEINTIWSPYSTANETDENQIWAERSEPTTPGGMYPRQFIEPQVKAAHLIDSTNRTMPFLGKVRSDEHFLGHGHSQDTMNQVSFDHEQSRLAYTGEFITHQFLEQSLHNAYDPLRHWTSSIGRRRAGLLQTLEVASDQEDSFTLDGYASERMKSLLRKMSQLDVDIRDTRAITYHIQIGVTAGDKDEPFIISGQQLERMRRFRIEQTSAADMASTTDVSILLRISNVFLNPIVEVYAKPWHLWMSGRMSLTGDSPLKATITGPPQKVNIYPLAAIRPYAVGAPSEELSDMYQESSTQQGSLTPEVHLEASLNDPFPIRKLRYHDLEKEEIRLLTLLPAIEERAPLRAHLEHVSHHRAGTYRTLSYVWGVGHRTKPLETSQGRLSITRSLHRALQHLRRKRDPVVLWVDAVCINQENAPEKEKQIRSLPHIFQSATSTLAFLTGSGKYNQAIETLMQILASHRLRQGTGASVAARAFPNEITGQPSAANSTLRDLDPWPKHLPAVPKLWEKRPIPLWSDPVWKQISELFNESWFRRVWIVQEVVLATCIRVLCGKWIFDWNDLHAAAEIVNAEVCMLGNVADLAAPLKNFLKLAEHRETEARRVRWPLLALLEAFRFTEASKPRDRLFALLGFATDGNLEGFAPDYISSLSMVLRRFAHTMIDQGHILHLLYRAGICTRAHDEAEDIPTWIPDWTTPRAPGLSELSSRGARYAASRKAEPECDNSRSGQYSAVISVHGHHVDKVWAVTGCSASDNLEQLKEYLIEVDEMVMKYDPGSGLYEDERADLKWKVPIASRTRPFVTSTLEVSMHDSYVALMSTLSNTGDKLSSSWKPSVSTVSKSKPRDTNLTYGNLVQDDPSENYKRLITESFLGWRVFVTKRGYIGVGPNTTQTDDEVVIIDGSVVPFLLRKGEFNSQPAAHQLVGECFVHGLMNGESERLEHRKKAWIDLC